MKASDSSKTAVISEGLSEGLSQDMYLHGFQAGWSAFWAMTRKELIVITRYPVQFVTSFAQVFFIILVFVLAAAMFSGVPGEGSGPDASVKSGVVAYGFIIFLFFGDALWTIGANLRQEQIQGTLEQLYLTPASKFASLVARIANLLIWTGSLSVMGALVFGLLLGTLPFKNPALGLGVLALSLSGTFGVGFAFAALTLYLKGTAETLANLFQFAFMILGANFFPFFVLPKPLLDIARLLPLSYCVDLFRSTLMGYPKGFPELAPVGLELVIVTVFGLLMPLLGYWLYRRAEDHGRRTGSLSEY